MKVFAAGFTDNFQHCDIRDAELCRVVEEGVEPKEWNTADMETCPLGPENSKATRLPLKRKQILLKLGRFLRLSSDLGR